MFYDRTCPLEEQGRAKLITAAFNRGQINHRQPKKLIKQQGIFKFFREGDTRYGSHFDHRTFLVEYFPGETGKKHIKRN